MPVRIQAGGRILTQGLLLRVWGQGNSGGLGAGPHLCEEAPTQAGDDPENPVYIFTKRRVGYWMEKGETTEWETKTPQ